MFNKLLIAVAKAKMDKTVENNDLKVVIVVVAVFLFLLPFLLFMYLCIALSMPAEWIKNALFRPGTPVEEIKIIQQIRPDTIEKEQTTLSSYEMGLPINRTITHYFGDRVGQRTLDYLTYNSNGDNLYAVADGKVKEIESSEALGGTYIIVEHNAPKSDKKDVKVYSKYWCIDKNKKHVDVGNNVKQGDIIAQAASAQTQNTTIVFCFQMYGDSDYEPIDPLPLIGEKKFDEQVVTNLKDGKSNKVVVANVSKK